MLLWCENCGAVHNGEPGDRCPACGEKKSRSPRENDPCFLCEKQILWAEMLEETLRNNEIPVIFKKKLGIGLALKVGPMMERVRIYVPYARLRDAEELLDQLFSEAGEPVDADGE